MIYNCMVTSSPKRVEGEGRAGAGEGGEEEGWYPTSVTQVDSLTATPPTVIG